MNTTRKSTTGRKRVTADGRTAPAVPKATGPSERERELELALVAAILANGGELVISPEHAWAASHRQDIEGVSIRFTARGLETEVVTTSEEDDAEPEPEVDPMAEAASIVDSADYASATGAPVSSWS